MGVLWTAVRQASKGLGRSPGFVVLVTLSLGLAVGVDALVLTWLEGLVLRPFPAIREAERLVVPSPTAADGSVAGMPPISWTTFREWRSRLRLVDVDVRGVVQLPVRREGDETPEVEWSRLVGGRYFELLGVAPAQGRLLTPDDETTAAPVAVVSDAFWRQELGGDPQVLGRTLAIGEARITVVGVAPPGFNGAIVGLGNSLWLPVTLAPRVLPGPDRLADREARWLHAIGRLRPGVSLEQARAELAAVGRRISEAAGERPVVGATARWVRDTQLGSIVGPVLVALLSIGLILLLAACANVAGLALARGTRQAREVALRTALGASRARAAAPVLAEVAILALLGAAAGLLPTLVAGDVFRALLPALPMPVEVAIVPDARVAVVSLVLALATMLVCGGVPAWRWARTDPAKVLGSGRAPAARGARLRGGLVVVQVAFATMTLVVAGLFLRSFAAAGRLELGFDDPERVLLVGTDLEAGGADATVARGRSEALLERVRNLPGVAAASLTSMVPLGFGGHAFEPAVAEGHEPARDEDVDVERVVVSDGYFATLGVAIVAGRPIDAGDRAGLEPVVVVNQALAEQRWPGADPLGRWLEAGGVRARVVGVARNATLRDLGEAPYPVAYWPLAQRPAAAMTVQVRTLVEPGSLLPAVRRELAAVHRDLPVLAPRPLAEHMGAARFVQVLGAATTGALGSLTLILAAVGLYGTLSYVVALRRRDLAIAMALGASRRDLLRDVFGRGLGWTLTGLAGGGLVAFLLARLLRAQLVGISPDDPVTYAAAAAVVVAVAVVACAGPAWRALAVEPAAALRAD